MVKIIVSDRKYDCEHLLGHFIGEEQYDTLIEEDCDLYAPNTFGTNNEDNILFKFRKNVFSEELQKLAYENMHEAAGRTENRGLASGTKECIIAGEDTREWVTNYQDEMVEAIIDAKSASLIEYDAITKVREKYPTDTDRHRALGGGRNSVWVISRSSDKLNFDKFIDDIIPLSIEDRAHKIETEIAPLISQTSYANPVYSGIAGFFDRYPRIPYGRATAYTEHNREKFDKSLPFFRVISNFFKELLPVRYSKQKECCDKLDKEFIVEGTPFTTITVNKTFRTAAHRDAGDLSIGFSNLTVVTNGKKYSGGHLIFPEYRIAVNIRPGDLLLVNNHEGMHGNTPVVLEEPGAERVSFVCYFREKMLELGSKEYEDTRFAYVESRRLNKDHPEQRTLWNGVSASMWDNKEWYDYLENKLGKSILLKYHPTSAAVNLSSFFE